MHSTNHNTQNNYATNQNAWTWHGHQGVTVRVTHDLTKKWSVFREIHKNSSVMHEFMFQRNAWWRPFWPTVIRDLHWTYLGSKHFHMWNSKILASARDSWISDILVRDAWFYKKMACEVWSWHPLCHPVTILIQSPTYGVHVSA